MYLYSQESCQLTLQLYTKYQSILDVLNDKTSKRANASKYGTLSLSTLLKFLKALFK